MSRAKKISDKYLSFSQEPGKVQKKPVEVDFMVWDGTNFPAMKAYTKDQVRLPDGDNPYVKLLIDTLEGEMVAKRGDAIITGVEGEIYACDAKIFFKTYDFITKHS